MEEKVFITEEFKQELQNLGCSYIDYITVYRKENEKVFFSAGKCKFHLTATELENVKKSAD